MESRVGSAKDLIEDRRRWQVRRAATCMVLLVMCALQAPGRLVGDTKADLTVDPLAFMGRALEMWDPSGFAGQVQNQAYGYLFPMGPFFALFDAGGAPSWVAQRVWWALLLSLAFLGANKLAQRLDIGSEWSRYVGALAYALSPRILSILGTSSVEAYPSALTPWVLIPLVSFATGRGVIRAAALSALGVGLMGGVNATVNLAAVLPAVLWFATRRWDRTLLRLGAWWAGFVAMGTLWWVVPLLLLGRYSPNFLDYIEDASTTTSTTNLIETVRGTSHWVGFLSQGLGTTWQIGGDLLTNPAFVANSLVIAIAGLIGIALLKGGERFWMVCCLLTGMVMVTFGHVAAIDGWFAPSQRDLLDGVLSPLRNVHKFDVLIRLPLALGVASLLGRVDLKQAWARRDMAVVVGSVTVAFAVVSMAGPALVGRLAPSDPYVNVPRYWEQTGTWLEDNPNGRALLAPGARFGRYLWGSPNDEILQTLTTAEWEVRNAIPLTPAGHIRMLDAIERQFHAGQPSVGLADYMRRNGIGYVVVRHDLADRESHARTGFVEQVLSRSPGFDMVKTFGPEVNPASFQPTIADSNLDSARKAIEIWKVGETRPDRATLTKNSSMAVVSGDSQSLLDLAEGGLLPAGATVMSSDVTDARARPAGATILTDSLRRREVNFGMIGANQSSTMTRDGPLTIGRKVFDYVMASIVGHIAYGEWTGVKNVRASSSVADARSESGIRTDGSVRALFDSDLDTAWSARALTAGTEQTVTLELDRAVRISSMAITLAKGTAKQIRDVTVMTDGGEVRTALVDPDDDGKWTLEADLEANTSVVIRFEPREGVFAPVRVAEVELEGVSPQFRVRMPGDLPSGPDVVLASAPVGFVGGCLSVVDTSTRCSPTIERAGEDDAGLRRVFHVDDSGEFRVGANAAMRPGRVLNDVYRDVMDPGVTATVSSSQQDVPIANAFALLDGDTGTSWIAAAADADPQISVKLDKSRSISRLRFRYDDSMPASRPASVTVVIDGKEYQRIVDKRGAFRIPRTNASSFDLVFTGDDRTASYDPTTGQTRFVSAGVGELEIQGVPANPERPAKDLSFGCGEGPVLAINGRSYETSVAADSASLLRGEAVPVAVCGGNPDLSRGDQQLSFKSSDTWRVRQVALARTGVARGSGGSQDLKTPDWGSRERRIEVPARSERSYLAISENISAGWQATFEGERLSPVTIDGWKQGFTVPAGAAGVVTLEFAPAGTYLIALTSGLVLLAFLGVVGVLVLRRRHEAPVVVLPSSPPAILAAIVLVGAMALIGGLSGAVAGVVALAVARLSRARTGRTRAWIAPVLLVTVGAVATGFLVLRPAGSADYFGNDALSQLLVLALLALACVWWPARSPSGAGVGAVDRVRGKAAKRQAGSRATSRRRRRRPNR
ncbi:MAG: alpha-(1-_3)-arabinofuranosyltransferase [Actinomycetota bacterium]|nr:alpha-(1->3)-arabinofuranosyltransferase [Actinomycetota bacterium]